MTTFEIEVFYDGACPLASRNSSAVSRVAPRGVAQ